MTAPDGLAYPVALDALEAEHEIAIAEDDRAAAERRKLSVNPMLTAYSDNLDEVVAALEEAEAQVDTADEAGDYEAMRTAERLCTALSRRVWELEEERTWSEIRAERSARPIVL